jgi:hypothetical protein
MEILFIPDGVGENHSALCVTPTQNILIDEGKGGWQQIKVDGLGPGDRVRMEYVSDAGTRGYPCGMLDEAIKFNDSGCVYDISMFETKNSPFRYLIQVDGQGPSGFTSGSGYLFFTDQTGDTYHLSLFRHGRDIHEVSFNSDRPKIVKIRWSNKQF